MVRRSKSPMMLNLALMTLSCVFPVRFGLAEISENPIARSLNNYEPDIEPYDDRRSLSTRPIFNYRKNGVKIDVRVVPAVNDSTGDAGDRFPDFPTKDLARCFFDLSINCARDRIARFIDTIGTLDEITLFVPGVKFVKTKTLQRTNGERRMIDTTDGGAGKIDRSIDDFFDSFALRINLPRINAKRERNQIDVMLDDNGTVEGRGKKGGGGGGKGGGKCKKMMMMMMMMGKMKLMAMAGMMSMKGMMMAGMSLMISKAMLIMKLMSLKMGGGGFGGGGGGGGGQLKEIVLLTKSSAGAGSGSGGGPPIDSYGAPPSSSYGAPSSGGGGYDYSGGGGGGGGGWGRSFDNRISMSSTVYQPETIYPQNYTDFSKHFDPVSPNQLSDDPTIGNDSAHWNETTIWDSWKSWNVTNYLESPEQNATIDTNNYDPKNNEFEAIRVNIPNINGIIDRNRSNDLRTTYANTWKNYKAVDGILKPRIPIVAIRRPSRDRAPKSIPIEVT